MALTYTQITAITEKLYIPKLIDSVYNDSPVLKRMNMPGKLKLKTGGTSIMCPVVSSKPSNGAYYDGLEELNTSASDNITSAEFQWKQLHEPIRIARKDLLMNSGDAQKLSLIESKMKIAESNIRENLSLGIFSDGTAATGAGTTKQITGFRALMSASTTYGGIAVADMAEWIANVYTNSTVARALTLNLMQKAHNAARYESGKPTAVYCPKLVYNAYWSLLQPHQRIFNSEMGKLGFTDILEFNGLPVLSEDHMLAGYMYFVDEENTYLAVHRDENLRVKTLTDLETSNSMLTHIYWMGNLVSHSRRTNSAIGDIETV